MDPLFVKSSLQIRDMWNSLDFNSRVYKFYGLIFYLYDIFIFPKVYLERLLNLS